MTPDKPVDKQKLILAIAIAFESVKMAKAGQTNEQVKQFLMKETNGDETVLGLVVHLLQAQAEVVQS